MQWSDVSFTPSTRVLRQFAGLVLVVFGSLAVWYGVGGDRVGLAIACGAVAAVVGPVGLIVPRVIRPVFVGWMVIAFPIGWTVSRLLLALIFYGLFTPIGIAFRLMGRDRLRRRRVVSPATYWTPRTRTTEMGDYLRQF